MSLNIVIIGNSSSGKSSLARKLVEKFNSAYLDLDTVAWEKQIEPIRKSLVSSMAEINHFINLNNEWIIEGCYGDLIEEILPKTDVLIFLNPDVNTCLNNAKNRGWESHKYENLDAQNANLKMLENWIQDYWIRDDNLSFVYHEQLFRSYLGTKIEYNKNWDDNLLNIITKLR